VRNKNLDKIKVLVDELKITNASDTYLTLEYIPEQFGIGKNLIKFRVSNFNLVPNSYIDFEAFDNNNTPIKINYLKTKSNFSRYISLEITDEISNGQGLLIVVLKAKNYPNGVIIDPKINNTFEYNVRYKYPIYINKYIETESDVYFDEEPNIEIKEIIAPNYKSYPEDLIRSNTITGSIFYKIDSDNVPYIYCNGFEINKDIINNGYLTINDITGSYDKSKYYFDYSSSLYNNIPINKILNKTNFTINKPILLSNFNNLNEFKLDSFNGNATITYDTFTNIAQPISQSYLNLDITNLEPKTGKVDSFDLYYKADSLTDSNYRYITTQEIKNSNLLIDKNSNKLDNSIGNIYSQEIIDTYYEIEYYNNLTPPTASIIYNDNILFNSFVLNYPYTQTNNQYYSIKTKDQYSMSFSRGNYSIEFDLIGQQSNDSPGNPNLICLISGSAFLNDINYNGKVVFNFNQTLKYRNYGRIKFNFNSDDNGFGILKFLYKRGNFYISNIEIKSNVNRGSNPKSTNINVPLNLDCRFEDVNFKIDFNDTKNKKSNVEINKQLKNYIGSNTYINGDDNQLYGKMRLSNDPSKGIEISGDREGGFLKSNLLYQNTGSLTPSGSGFILFDYTSGSKYNLETNDNSINNNVGFDLFAENGDYLIYRGYGSSSGIFFNSKDIPTITNATGGTPLSIPFLNGDLGTFFDLQFTSSINLNVFNLKLYNVYYALIKNNNSTPISINLPLSSSYDIYNQTGWTISSGSYREFSVMRTINKRIWQVSEELIMI
jgi:hypothetical protein